MNTDDKRAFLSALRDLLVRHSVTSMYATYEGEIYVGTSQGFDFCDLGTIEEIEQEIENL